MLGWSISVRQKAFENNEEPHFQIAKWITGASGIDWIFDLVETNQAELLKDGGYPCKFGIKADLFRTINNNGLPKHNLPQVVGEDYYLPAGFNGRLHLNAIVLNEIPYDEDLVLIAWDQS